MDGVAANGWVEVAKWLHRNRDEGATGKALFLAAKVTGFPSSYSCKFPCRFVLPGPRNSVVLRCAIDTVVTTIW